MFQSEYKDDDDEYAFFSCYRIRKLELLDVKVLSEHIFNGVYSPKLIWLRWYKCHLSSLPSWISMNNLWVLEVHGDELKTLREVESQVNGNLLT